MYKDMNGNWRVSGDANADWAQCITKRDEEMKSGEYCPEAALMAMALLSKKINRDIKTISVTTHVPAITFDEDYREEVLLLVLRQLPRYQPATGPFVTMIYNDMQQLVFKFKQAPYSGGGGAPSYYQSQTNETSTMSVEAMRHSVNMKNCKDSDCVFELVDESDNSDIEKSFIEREEHEGVEIVRKRYPFQAGSRNSLYNAAAVAKLLGGYASLPNTIKAELGKIWNATESNTDISQNDVLESSSDEPDQDAFDAEPLFV